MAKIDSEKQIEVDVVVLGGGPGGYSAAFRAADLGLTTALVERYHTLGGVCLNVGCIPSKALLHTAAVLEDMDGLKEHGIVDVVPRVSLDGLRAWKDGVIKKLTGGLSQLAKQRKVQIITGIGEFFDSTHMLVKGDADTTITFKNAIVAAGSSGVALPGFPDDDRIMNSTDALALKDVPKKLLVIGGGIIGLEMATVYSALGSDVTVVELLDSLIAGCDKDLVRPLQSRLKKKYKDIFLSTKVTEIKPLKSGLKVSFDGAKAPPAATFDKVLVSVGRRPNGKQIGAEAAGIKVDDEGFIPVDKQQRSNVPNIFAIGDIVGQPMLAHKAAAQGKVAAEVIAGEASGFDVTVIPSVAYTSPEIAWVGITETQAKAQGLDYGVGKFPFAASGRAMTLDRTDGFTKLIFDNTTNRIVGAGIVGANAGELIAELALAIEMGADAADIALTVHPHPSLSESVAMAAEAFEGTITDIYLPNRKK